jgi:hypothetical protein
VVQKNGITETLYGTTIHNVGTFLTSCYSVSKCAIVVQKKWNCGDTLRHNDSQRFKKRQPMPLLSNAQVSDTTMML